MVDAGRSKTMRAVKSTNTTPELQVRKLLTRAGYRYRLHRRDLPGAPDIVFPGRRKCIFVHGCFWHQHDCARGNRQPKDNANYWARKLQRNQERDLEHIKQLTLADWKVLVVWECELRRPSNVQKRLARFLGASTEH